MGIDRDSAKFLLWARQRGVDFSRPLMIGRMGLHLTIAQLRRVLAEFGLERTHAEVAALFAERNGYAEPFFRLLGAEGLTSLDASGFEGATLLHDLNRPIPEEWRARYSVVFDGGTLEHVFNYPTGLRNCLEMVAVGGHFLTITPANNYMGHGFYQFSPELYARVLHEENGFALEKMFVFEPGADRWYEVVDPATAGKRVRLVNRRPTLLVAWARRTHLTEIFAQPPQQSDYTVEWDAFAGQPRTCRQAQRQQKSWLRRLLRRVKKWFQPRYPAAQFQPVNLRAAPGATMPVGRSSAAGGHL
jgi:hypothetical protein